MKVITGNFRNNKIDDIIEELRDVIYSNIGTLSVAEVVGMLEILKLEIFNEQTYMD